MKLPDVFYTMPDCAHTTMSREDLKELLLSSGGWVMACGRNWDIQSKDAGAGVYRVTLKLREYGREESPPAEKCSDKTALMRKALKAAQHDLITTAGLYCTDIVQDGVKLPGGFQLEHSSLALIEEALK